MRFCEKCGEKIPKEAVRQSIVVSAHRPVGDVRTQVHLVFEGEGEICESCGLGLLGEGLPTLARLLEERRGAVAESPGDAAAGKEGSMKTTDDPSQQLARITLRYRDGREKVIEVDQEAHPGHEAIVLWGSPGDGAHCVGVFSKDGATIMVRAFLQHTSGLAPAVLAQFREVAVVPQRGEGPVGHA